jgi:hypothetical protein
MTNLMEALRKKFKTPKEAMAALGLDESLIASSIALDSFAEVEKKAAKEPDVRDPAAVAAAVGFKKYGKAGMERKAHGDRKIRTSRKRSISGDTGKTPRVAGDSKERSSMTTKTKWSPTALVAMGVVGEYLAPRLAQDAKIDLRPIFTGVAASNFKSRRPFITSRLRAAVNGNLAQDADIEDLGEVLDRIDELADEGREALGEARADEGEDAPEDLTEGEGSGEMEGAGGGEDDNQEIREFLADKLSPEDLETVCAMMRAKAGDEEPAMKPDENDEEKKEKEAAMDKKAMDAAIAAAIQANDRKHVEIAAARSAVRPYVGELTIGCDSAEAVYRHALTALGVNVKDIHRDALPAILAAQPKPGARRVESRLAQDAVAAKGFAERFPSASRIGTI